MVRVEAVFWLFGVFYVAIPGAVADMTRCPKNSIGNLTLKGRTKC